VLQMISVLGALAILGAYAASQLGFADASKPSYEIANLLGSAVLTVVAIIDWQLGFILLEGAWALMSLWVIATILRPRGSASPSTRSSVNREDFLRSLSGERSHKGREAGHAFAPRTPSGKGEDFW
jgi:hypothetical protein